jgi:hypothetical protein
MPTTARVEAGGNGHPRSVQKIVVSTGAARTAATAGTMTRKEEELLVGEGEGNNYRSV